MEVFLVEHIRMDRNKDMENITIVRKIFFMKENLKRIK